MASVVPMHPVKAFPVNDKAKEKYMFGDHESNGGGDMGNGDKYVTHAELNNAIDKISNKIDLVEAHIDTKFEQVNTKFEIVNTKLIEHENNQIKWFIGTAIAIVGLTVSLIKFL